MSLRRVIQLAQDHAQDLQHHYIGTEHLLLVILLEEQGGAVQVLNSLGPSPRTVRVER